MFLHTPLDIKMDLELYQIHRKLKKNYGQLLKDIPPNKS